MSFTRSILMNHILNPQKVDNEYKPTVHQEETTEDKMDKNSDMVQAIAELIKNHQPAPPPQAEMKLPRPRIGERIGIMLSQHMLGFDPSDEVARLVNEVKRHHPIDDTHRLIKLELKRMDDDTFSLFVEWEKHEYSPY